MTNLEEFRKRAALASKGLSNDAIKNLAHRLLARYCRECRSLLDYGAGTGELLKQIALRRTHFAKLAGVDIFDRPADLPAEIEWTKLDLNSEFDPGATFDVVVSTEVIEHLENPRATMRNIVRLMKPGGWLILTTPNQHSWRSIFALIVTGHFVAFSRQSYPAHLTALTRVDLERIARECGLIDVSFHYTNCGGLPKMPRITWQQISAGLLRGQRFSDNIAMVARKPAG